MTFNLNFGEGLGAGIFGTLLFVWWAIYKNPDRFQKWCGMGFWFLSRVWNKYEYLAIKSEVQGKINSFVGNLENQVSTTFPRVKIQWADKEAEGIVWEENEIVLIMKDRKHKSKNVLNAAYFFTSEALLRKAKMHLSKTQKLSLDLYATKRILEEENPGLEEQFMDDYFVPELNQHPEIKSLVNEYLNIDAKGLFFPVLIQEINFLGTQVFLSNPSSEIIQEIKALIDFLNKFSQSEVASFPDEDFIGRYTRCGIKIVAGRETRESGNVYVHVQRLERALRSGLANIYVIGGIHENNKQFIQNVCSAITEKYRDVKLLKKAVFDGQIIVNGRRMKVQTYFIHIHNPAAIKFIHPSHH